MYAIIKRFFDFFFSFIGTVVISPIMIPIMIGLKLTGEGHIWYFQERVGYKNKIFSIYKFATMLKDSPNMSGGIITTKKDPRITPMGGFLRSSKINELPQIINVLKGHMSLVGPRPVMPKSFAAYPDEIQKIIYNVPPGITGIGSIVFRNEEELITQVRDSGGDTWDFYKNEIYPYKGLLEKWYQENQSFTNDFMILFLTAWAIIFPNTELHYQVFKDLPKKPGTISLVAKQ